jgi:uncharacterized repeat protein (TIGR03806 family)
LSDYGYFEGELLELQPAPGVIPYDVSAPLWSDNSAKKRFIVLPEGKSATVDESGAVQFPIGTALIKNFGFPSTPDGQLRWVETRLLVHEAEGWVGHVYLWNDEQTDAKRYVAGAEVTVQRMTDSGEELEQQYIVPSTTQCVSCHGLDEAVVPLGLVAHQLNRSVKRGDGELNQLTWLSQQGVFGESVLAPEDYKTLPDPFGEEELDSRARAYLEVNCAHCHRAGGNAESAGLSFVHTETDPTALGICKTTVAAGAGAGEFKFDIVPGNAAESILVFRMSSTDPGIKMPELPTLLPHQEGVELVRAWIDAMPSNDCSVSTDESESSADSE